MLIRQFYYFGVYLNFLKRGLRKQRLIFSEISTFLFFTESTITVGDLSCVSLFRNSDLISPSLTLILQVSHQISRYGIGRAIFHAI